MNIFNITIHHLSSLHLLDLSSNKLSRLDKDTRTSLDRLSAQKEVFLNLQGNPLQCSCSNMDFLVWIVQSKNILFHNRDKYTCLFQNATRQEFGNFSRLMEQLEKECSSYSLIITVSSSLLFIIVTIIMSRIIHRYRWKLRYMYFVVKGRSRNQKSSRDQISQSKYHFDAFISYANNDSAFAISLVKYMEENHGLQLCLHQRDFIPGTDIADNITNAIHISKRTICILTSHYLKSYWCNYEMNMARMEAVYSRKSADVLFFVILQKSVVKELPWKWMDLLERKSYMYFPAEDGKDVPVFRTKLAETLLMEEY
ncbi:toll-like receptor 4 [Saccostrea cucullata]|uniref:toll-like receptor 4 n=1 Tax=Saccostrea cuccullata TaxID=36930 RepID=UPI002ED2AC58